MVRQTSAAFACLFAGIVCFTLVNFRIVTGAVGLVLIVIAVVNWIVAIYVFSEYYKKR
jgi:uncharacterized membrane protein required for colicin V production